MELKDLREKLNKIDKEMAGLFEERMEIIAEVSELKQKMNLPTHDKSREMQMIENNCLYIKNKVLVKYYVDFLKSCLKISKDYQEDRKKK